MSSGVMSGSKMINVSCLSGNSVCCFEVIFMPEIWWQTCISKRNPNPTPVMATLHEGSLSCVRTPWCYHGNSGNRGQTDLADIGARSGNVYILSRSLQRRRVFRSLGFCVQ